MVKDKKTVWYAIYCGALMAMNILAAKQIDIWRFTVTCGIFTSGFIFVAQDVMTELYGVKESRKMIFSGYAVSLTMTALYQLAIIVPPSVYWTAQEAFSTILQTTLRITIASFIAYSVGSIVNTKIMAMLKAKHPESLFIRAVTSTTAGQLLDNGLFAFIAFLGVLPINALVSMTVGGTIIEIITEIICFPLVKKLTEKGAD